MQQDMRIQQGIFWNVGAFNELVVCPLGSVYNGHTCTCKRRGIPKPSPRLLCLKPQIVALISLSMCEMEELMCAYVCVDRSAYSRLIRNNVL